MPTLLEPGTTVAGLRIEAVVGEGGMGVVYRAWEDSLGRSVALKLMSPELAEDAAFRERFLEEMRLAASLEHPHVCPVYAAGEEDGLLYLALRFIDGEDAARLVGRDGALAPQHAVELLHDLAGALDQAHARGLLHRDVKPENVLVDSDGNAYLSDFGLARPLGRKDLAKGSELEGTLLYLAPERIEGVAPTPFDDQYAFACLAYFVLAGKPPFVRSHEAALLFAHLRDEPPSLEEHGLARLDPVLRRGLAKRAEARYPSCSAFVSELVTALAGPELTKTAWPESLPRPRTSFLGRVRELDELVSVLAEGVRLLTLTGPGGTGKTRLALELAARLAGNYEDGAVWVSLAALREPELVLPAIARALGEPDGQTAGVIGRRELLLCLDNLEQLLPEVAAPLASLLDSCPALTLVCTSRASLHVERERVYGVPSLQDADAVSLFHERAEGDPTSLQHGEAREICRLLDCLPLAVELAAARTKLLSPQALLSRLETRLPLLTGGPRDAPARQQTLAATLDWSFDLLGADERQLFERLWVFHGGFTLTAAEEVCEADLEPLTALLDASLIRHRGTTAGDARFDLLAIVREYAAAKQTRDTAALHERHARYYLEVVREADEQLTGPQQAEWFTRLAQEQDNIRAALTWAAESQDHELMIALVAAAGWFWFMRGELEEGSHWIDAALATGAGSPSIRATVLMRSGAIADGRGDYETAERRYREAFELRRSEGDLAGAVGALNNLGALANSQADNERANAWYEQGLAMARTSGDELGIATVLGNMGIVAINSGDPTRAVSLLEESIGVLDRLGHRYALAVSRAALGSALLELDDLGGAAAQLSEALVLHRELEEPLGVWTTLEELAVLAAVSGHGEHAAKQLGAASTIRTGMGAATHPADEPRRTRAASLAVALIGQDAFDEAYREGLATELDAAVESALAAYPARVGP